VSLYLSQSAYVLFVLDDQSAKVVRRYRFIPTALIASDMCSRHMFLATDSVGVSKPGGSLDRRVNRRCVPQPRWVGARRNAKGGEEQSEGDRRGRWNPRPSC
jgi:hypothetical protein